MCEAQYHFGVVSEAPGSFWNGFLTLVRVINTPWFTRGVGKEGGLGAVTSPAAWEAMGGLRFRSGKHHFVVGVLRAEWDTGRPCSSGGNHQGEIKRANSKTKGSLCTLFSLAHQDL